MFNYQTLLTNPVLFLVDFLALIISIGVHEFSHVLSAYLQGDQTGKLMGRLTLNPIKHLDPVGTLAMIFIGLGWGKPAPFNPYALRNRRWGPALVALAGPISNILLVLIVGYTAMALAPALPSGNLLGPFLGAMILLNAALAIFNLIPIAPLDGSHLLEAILGPENALVRMLHTYGPYLLIVLVLFPNSPIGMFITGGVGLILRVFGLNRLF